MYVPPELFPVADGTNSQKNLVTQNNTNILSYNSGGQKFHRSAGCIPSGGSRGRIHLFAFLASRSCPQFLAGAPLLHFQSQQWPVGQGTHHVGDNACQCQLP